RRRRDQAGQHPDRGGLAAAVGAEQAEDLAAAHLEVEVLHRHDPLALPAPPCRSSSSTATMPLCSLRSPRVTMPKPASGRLLISGNPSARPPVRPSVRFSPSPTTPHTAPPRDSRTPPSLRTSGRPAPAR